MPVIRRAGGRHRTLPLDLLDLLLGIDRPGAEVDALEAQGIPYDPFVFLDYSDAEIAALRQRHRRELTKEWKRRGGTGQPWAETTTK